MASSMDMQEVQFPTLGRLGVKLPEKIDSLATVSLWFSSFAKGLEAGDAVHVADLLLADGFWRDLLAFTWDFRTFYSRDVLIFLTDRLQDAKISKVTLNEASVQLQQPYPDVVWIHASFTFETELGICFGIVRLVPTSDHSWKAHTVFTNLEDLHGHPEMVGEAREPAPNHGRWLAKRRKEIECADADEQPSVVIIGAGQSGLEVAARLKYLGVKSLIIEKEARVGHLWRTRYEALCLHDPVWNDHMPYMPFPSTWPVYTPAPKIAAWLEDYAFHLELNVWTSTKLIRCTQDPETLKWTVKLERSDGSKRTLIVNHVVGAIGFSGGRIHMPDIPQMSEYQGKTLHSAQYATARDYIGKKVVVVGACTSAHDICRDLYEHGVDVTMIQRSSTYVMSAKNGIPVLIESLWNENSDPNMADRIAASFPVLSNKEIQARNVKGIAEADKEMLNGLAKVGFRTNLGIDGTGSTFLALAKVGGYYLDVGTSQLIIDGKIKLKSDSGISNFTGAGLQFQDGSTLNADVVLFATGYENPRETYVQIFGDAIANKLGPIWGLDAEGELRSVWRDTGVPRLWCMMGSFALCRFYSKRVALQIKAMEEGLWDGSRYSRGD